MGGAACQNLPALSIRGAVVRSTWREDNIEVIDLDTKSTCKHLPGGSGSLSDFLLIEMPMMML